MEEKINKEEVEEITEKDLLDEYKKLSISSKRKELGREIAEMTIMIQKLAYDVGQNSKIKPIEELENLYDGSLSEDDYLSGLYEDILDFKELLGSYLLVIANSMYK